MLRLAAAIVLLAAPLHAEEVTLEHDGIVLLADLVEAGDDEAPVALITHGTLAHKDMELVEGLQDALAERGITSLAHTLSFGVDRRTGMADCSTPHTHRDTDADDEIAAWIDWLADRNVDAPVLIGHSRGGKQVARLAAGRDDLSAVILMAPATTSSTARGRKGYEARYGEALWTVLERAKAVEADDILAVPGFLHCPDAKARSASFQSYYGGPATGADTHVGDIVSPVLVVLAQKDAVLPKAPAAFAPLRSDSLDVKIVEDADHMFLDFYVEDAADLIETFVAGLGQGVESGNATIDFSTADLEYGAYLAQECTSCHRVGGAQVPSLNGLDAEHIYEALGDYATGLRANPAMGLVARSLDEEQRIALSAYFALQKDY